MSQSMDGREAQPVIKFEDLGMPQALLEKIQAGMKSGDGMVQLQVDGIPLCTLFAPELSREQIVAKLVEAPRPKSE